MLFPVAAACLVPSFDLAVLGQCRRRLDRRAGAVRQKSGHRIERYARSRRRQDQAKLDRKSGHGVAAYGTGLPTIDADARDRETRRTECTR